jgi:metal-sulfur cluster biosynthetic enzyme
MYSQSIITKRSAAIVFAIAFAVCGLAHSGTRWAQAVAQDITTQRANIHVRAADRTDSFETKVKLLEEAWKRRDFDLARSLTRSLRDTVLQTQLEEQNAGPSLIDTLQFQSVDSLPATWRQWAHGWKYAKALSVAETAGEARSSEPVEVTLSFPNEQVTSLQREIRVARVDQGRLIEVPSQVFGEVRRPEQRFCKILWMVDSRPKQRQDFLVFYGNPDAELPEYPSDLTTQGDGVGLDISNAIFKVSLSKQSGQIERLTLRREHGLELYSGGEGHGEPPGIDWAHDYVDAGGFQKLRITLWDTCPDYEVVRGPLCTIVRRWGFPHSPIHPLYSPARLQIDVEYRFYSGLPWFHKLGSMKAVQSFEAAALRDDEWVLTGQSFTDKLWMGRDGQLRTGDVDPKQQNDLWGVGFFHRDTKDSFVALFLDHQAEGLPELKHTGAPTPYYRWHGSVWSRYPLPVTTVPKGAVLRQKNAYVTIPFTPTERKATIEKLRHALMNPLAITANTAADFSKRESAADLSPKPDPAVRLARPGEAGDAALPKQKIWEALRDCKDAQLYTADINVVDLGLVYDVRIRGDVVTVVMAMPHRGRPLLGYFIDGSISVHPTPSFPVRERLMRIPGVRQVVVKQTWEPGWSSNRLTDVGRRKLGLE